MSTATQAEFARMKGVSRTAVTKWKDQGRIVMVGNLVDVEASQERLLRYASHRAVGSLGPVNYQAAVNPPAWDWKDLPGDVGSVIIMALGVGIDAAEGILRHTDDEAFALAVADWVTAQNIRAAIELIDEHNEPPAAFGSWAAHPVFADTPAHREPFEWEDLIRDCAEYRAGQGCAA